VAPGTDHAAIATQSKVEKLLEKEGVRKADLGREEFLKRVNDYAMASHDTIVNQARKMGASLDWSREAFTLDEARTKAVNTAFTRMYADGLIYRGHRMVNWDPKGQTVISDDELVYVEEKTKFYYFKYGPFTIGTARPETKFGDKYVVMHPDDARYAEYKHGDTLTVEWINGPIEATIIKDPVIDMEFGTGVMTITPWHSQSTLNWQKYKLDKEQIIDQYGKLLPVAGEFAGMKISEARAKIVEKLDAKGLVVKTEDYTHNIATAERTGAMIEPQLMTQWFIDVNKKFTMKHSEINGIKEGDEVSLKDLMRQVVENGQITIMPERYDKIYRHWIDNLRDWCISRQIWYGHRIPVWYDKEGNKTLPKETTVYLARHGESEFNISPTFKTQKIADETPLTEKGRADAEALAESLRDKKITKIVRSGLIRAQQTAEIVANKLGINISDIEVMQELQEIRVGEFDGVEKPKGYNPLKWSIENNIQTLEEVELQAKSIIEKFKNFNTEDRVLVVGHGGINSVVQAIECSVAKENFVAFKDKMGPTKNGSFTEMHFLSVPSDTTLDQDPDTLDTWFSSGLWTFSTLGWPNETPDLKTYHPTSVLETGHDILPFWVARMILMSTYHTGQIPFSHVYLHGMVRTADGKKMSKSLGDKAIDPLDLIERYGTDALRMACIVGVGPGNDLKLDENDIKGYSKFANKIWNATRFVIENTIDLETVDESNLDADDQPHFDELKALVEEITKEMNEFKFYIVSEKLYHYFWHTFADIHIEWAKTKIAEGGAGAISAKTFLALEIDILLRVLHPFMPFITEELWSLLPNKKSEQMLMVSQWPSRT
jgi:valyl-tRNA synthetase